MKRDVRDTRRLPPEVLARVGDAAGHGAPWAEIRDARGRGLLVETRSSTFEVRSAISDVEAKSGSVAVRGYATVYGAEYDVMGGPPYGWTETITAGACSKSVSERDDVRFLLNHEGLPLARTSSGTMTLTSDKTGLLVEAQLDPRIGVASDLLLAMERGDVDEMSFAFQVINQSWSDDQENRTITEVRLFDVSAVAFPANSATSISLTDDEPAIDPEVEPDEDDPVLDSHREAELVELERRGFALVDARALIALAR